MAVKMLLIAILIAVLMTLFSGIYPGSVLYGWLDQNGLNFVWAGLTAGIIAACLLLYRRRKSDRIMSMKDKAPFYKRGLP